LPSSEKYQDLYEKIGEPFAEILPMFEELLTEVNDQGQVRKQLLRFAYNRFTPRNWHSVPPFAPPKYAARSQAVNSHDCPLQVIVKLISLELDPKAEDYFNRSH
jgi:hypothetical protein